MIVSCFLGVAFGLAISEELELEDADMLEDDAGGLEVDDAGEVEPEELELEDVALPLAGI